MTFRNISKRQIHHVEQDKSSIFFKKMLVAVAASSQLPQRSGEQRRYFTNCKKMNVAPK